MAILKRGELVGLQLGCRGHWRIERVRLEEFIARFDEDTTRRMRDVEVGRPPTNDSETEV